MRKAKDIIRNNFQTRITLRLNRVVERDRLLERMGVYKKDITKIPRLIENDIEQVINPWFVYKMVSERGFPVEMVFEELEKGLGYKKSDYWSGWCDFWLSDFRESNHRLLLDSEWMINNKISKELEQYTKSIGIYEDLLKIK
jgi:hypothetical protein